MKKYTNDDQFNLLIDNFHNINERGFIKGVNNNVFSSVGVTFEHLLAKSADSTFFPDYYGIEIKCKQRYSNYPIVLFSIAFDGPSLFETNKLRDDYGYDYRDSGFKELFVNLRFREKVEVRKDFYFELDMDEEKLFINVYHKDKIIEKRGFLYLSSISERFNLKLNKLALVRASKRNIGKDLYFRYYKISCYYKKDFSNFIDSIKNNDIKLHICERCSKSEKDYGKNKSKGVSFELYIDNIENIFDLVYEFEDLD